MTDKGIAVDLRVLSMQGHPEMLEAAQRRMEGEGQPGYATEIRALKATP